jgi:hypothetical protein
MDGDPLRLSSPTWTALHEPVIIPSVPGPHRVRVSARGRTGHVDASVETPSEHYLVEAWSQLGLHDRETLRDDGVSM